MSRNTKIIIIVLIAVILFCICAVGAAFWAFASLGNTAKQSIKTNPDDVAAIGKRIADFDIPTGFELQGGMSLFGIDSVFIAPVQSSGSDSLLIVMMQFPSSLSTNPQQMEEQMKQAIQQQAGRKGLSLRTIESKIISVRGKDANETISEGTDDNGASYKQLMVIFEGKGGTAIVAIQGSTDQWDQTLADNFIGSLR